MHRDPERLHLNNRATGPGLNSRHEHWLTPGESGILTASARGTASGCSPGVGDETAGFPLRFAGDNPLGRPRPSATGQARRDPQAESFLAG